MPIARSTQCNLQVFGLVAMHLLKATTTDYVSTYAAIYARRQRSYTTGVPSYVKEHVVKQIATYPTPSAALPLPGTNHYKLLDLT